MAAAILRLIAADGRALLRLIAADSRCAAAPN